MPGRLKLIPEFSKKHITEYLTSSRLVSEKPCYLFASLVTPHAFSVDCQAKLRNGEMVTSDILLNLKTQYENCMHHYTPPIYFNRGLYVELVGEILLLLDDCGDTSNIEKWVEYFDGLNPVDETTLVKQGSHSMALGIDADLDVTDKAVYLNDEAFGDLSKYQHDWVYLWVYFPTLDYLQVAAGGFRYRIGSTAANFVNFQVLKAALLTGWNLIKCDLDNPTTITGTVDWSAIGYQRLEVTTVAGNTNDFTVYVDSIMFVRPFSGATDGITKGATVQYLIE